MLKMILADDEPVITRGIQKLIDWNKMGIEPVGVYEDGFAALQGILSLKPDIALLDISMPKKTGLDVLREIMKLGLQTQVVFISGFQEFEYVKEALAYGAVDYLLKPIKKDELIHTIEKCVANCRGLEHQNAELSEREAEKAAGLPAKAYEHLMEMEQTTYQPAAVEILYSPGLGESERRLIKFSVFSYIEQYFLEKNLGISFLRDNRIALILKGIEEESVKERLCALAEAVYHQTRNRIGLAVGDQVSDMAGIPAAYQQAKELTAYFFFSENLTIPMIRYGEPVFYKSYRFQDLNQAREFMMDSLFGQDQQAFDKYFDRFQRILCVISDGRKDDACFHFCNAMRAAEERFEQMGLSGLGLDMKELLEKAREARTYEQMKVQFRDYFNAYFEQVRTTVISSDKKDIMKAKNYIEINYKDNLSLEVLANHIHMNPYYFSSFFKKQTGENFKDYLNKVRMRHAMVLILGSDKKSYEVAQEVGFRDNRYFSELFQRYYHETPASYRKRVKSEK